MLWVLEVVEMLRVLDFDASLQLLIPAVAAAAACCNGNGKTAATS
jgi:hypothetical protein